jgi:alpha-methylacyl-CoA racemase
LTVEPSAGPLAGIRVLDLSALGPGPFCSMILADFGADVVEVVRPDRRGPDPAAFLRRGKRTIAVDLGHADAPGVIGRMAERVDVLLEGNRPGAMERRGLGPDELLARNPRLVYTRLTGWGQTGPYAQRAGHDVNYLAISGALGVTGTDAPVAPPALLGDLACGSFLAALGTVLALFERQSTGAGQVVDAAIVDGAALLLSAAFGELATGFWSGGRGTHVLSGAAPFYGVYRCADDGWYSVGAIEPRFYAAFLTVLGLDDLAADQWDQAQWPARRAQVADVFARRARDEWTEAFSVVDACGAPVLDIDELAADPHLAARQTVLDFDGRLHAAPAPRLSGHPPGFKPAVAESPAEVLRRLGFGPDEAGGLLDRGIVRPD